MSVDTELIGTDKDDLLYPFPSSVELIGTNKDDLASEELEKKWVAILLKQFF
jgi:hypothetical protein